MTSPVSPPVPALQPGQKQKQRKLTVLTLACAVTTCLRLLGWWGTYYYIVLHTSSINTFLQWPEMMPDGPNYFCPHSLAMSTYCLEMSQIYIFKNKETRIAGHFMERNIRIQNLQRTFFDVQCSIEMLGQIGQSEDSKRPDPPPPPQFFSTLLAVQSQHHTEQRDYICWEACYVDGRYHKYKM